MWQRCPPALKLDWSAVGYNGSANLLSTLIGRNIDKFFMTGLDLTLALSILILIKFFL